MLVVFFRTLILFTLVILVMRIMGKRQIGQIQPFELAVSIMISELAAVPMQNTGIPLVSGIIPILTLLLAQLLISFVSLKSSRVRGFICGKPRILIKNGKIQESNLRKELYTLNDLLEQLRIKSTPNIADVEFAILETNGELSIIPKSQKRPLSPQDMNLSTNYEGLPIDLVIDGDVILKNLHEANLTMDWLRTELSNRGISSLEKVLFASLDSSGQLYCQTKNPREE